eukprot:2676760-Alexandrium_andersonii.AAC.1
MFSGCAGDRGSGRRSDPASARQAPRTRRRMLLRKSWFERPDARPCSRSAKSTLASDRLAWVGEAPRNYRKQ